MRLCKWMPVFGFCASMCNRKSCAAQRVCAVEFYHTEEFYLTGFSRGLVTAGDVTLLQADYFKSVWLSVR